MNGFFTTAELTHIKRPVSLLPACGACGLFKHCHSPKMKVNGRGRKGILIVGESPGQNEDDRGIPFCGEAGDKLQKHLRKHGIDMREDCWVTNSLICHPWELGPTGQKRNRTPSDDEIRHCRPNVLKAVRELQPSVILLLGGSPLKSFLGHVWKQDVGPLTKWVGWTIPMRDPNAWVAPNYHPSYLVRQQDDLALEHWFDVYLERALTKVGQRPWADVPNEQKDVTVLFDPKTAAFNVRQFVRYGKPVAFDYETNRLKPDGEGAWVVCCSVSNGEFTIAYPWQGEAIQATQELLRSPLPKVGSNIKFEERWTHKQFGHGVRNWWWDTMLAAHWLDNRDGICSVKFQAFVRLGMPSYNDHIKPYLKGVGGNGDNKIRSVALKDLLLYCGLDSLAEIKVAYHQRKEAGLA